MLGSNSPAVPPCKTFDYRTIHLPPLTSTTMPGVYREKVCPNCSTTHRKRGEFCGQACASSYRGQTEETKKKLSKIKREYDLTPEGIAHNKMLSRIMTNPEEPRISVEDFAVDIPTIRDIRDYDLDGYDHAEDW